ncbi:MFS transporter [Inhella gelatinilytica]|uniref:MFS transporter n=1 Tax=Inhella gelatinilytica TaxID=2795030 RepID=A0A931ITS4_9BURK|nr:MFS transporter [Inhella gelatinilytica]MBH9551817.1 MFS transporter [Inhella gelatinilytica]
MGQRRFAPFFWTQFLGAANDNLFKFAFTMIVTFQLSVSWMPPAQAGLVIGAVFILPFVLFSATAGQLADKLDKRGLMRAIKNLEVFIMALAAWGLYTQQVAVLLACIFLLGLHSTFFGPVKYAYMPQHLAAEELTGGNGMVEMGTFVAILAGNLVGGALIAIPGDGPHYVAWAGLALAVAGRLAAQALPPTPASDAGLTVNWNPVSETWRNLHIAHQSLVVFRSLLGISWMWFVGAVFLGNFPAFAKDVLHGNEQVASLLLAVFSVGIALGSLACEMLSRRMVEIGLVPLGAIGMTVFAVDLYFACQGLPPAPAAAYGLGAFVAAPGHLRVMADLALLAACAGLYSVPMYALIQLRAQATHRARIIAANNILNALFMIGASLSAGLLLSQGASVPELFLFVGLANAVVGAYIFLVVPEYLLRFVAFVLSHTVYRLRLHGAERIPTEGAALLVCNHVSFIDAVLLMGVSPRPVRFLMDHRIFKTPVLGWLFRLAKAIPIAPQKEDPQAYERAFAAAEQVLREGDLLAIFPEGGITRDGTLQPFKGGLMKILDAQPVPVVPMALKNLWGSFFSRIEGGQAMVKPFRRGLFSPVEVVVGEAVAPSSVTPETLQARVQELLA